MADYHAIFEEMPDGVTLHDPSDGAVLETNQEFCEMLGYIRDELLGLGFEDIHVDEPPTQPNEQKSTSKRPPFKAHKLSNSSIKRNLVNRSASKSTCA